MTSSFVIARYPNGESIKPMTSGDRLRAPSMEDVAPPVNSAEPGRIVVVTVPAQAEFVGLLRTVVGSFASSLDFTVAEIEDLRLAMTEVASQLLDEPPPPQRLSARLTEVANGIEVIATRTSAAEVWPSTGVRSSLTGVMLR